MLVTLPIGFLVGAFLTDVAYVMWPWATWAYFSSWLIATGIVTALLAAIFGFIDFFGEPRIRQIRKSWYHMIGNLLAVVLSIVNLFVHNRDGAMAVIPLGISLSTIVVLILIFNGWMGGGCIRFGHRWLRQAAVARPEGGNRAEPDFAGAALFRRCAD